MPFQRSSVATPALTLVTLACAPALAQSAPAAPAAPATTTTATAPTPTFIPPGNWSVRLEPQVWYVAPEGKLTLPGSAAGVPAVEFETLNSDEPEASPAGQVTIRIAHNHDDKFATDTFWKSGWFFTVGGGSFSGEADSIAPAGGFTLGSLAVAGGATVSTDVEWSTFNAMVGKWITGDDFDTGGEVHVDLYAVAGLRVHTQDITVTSGGGSTAGDESFISPLLGVRLNVQLPYNLSVDVNANVNFFPGDTSSYGFEISPTFTWRPTANLGVEIGYRLLISDTESGDEGDSDYYRLDGSLAGLYAGIEIRF